MNSGVGLTLGVVGAMSALSALKKRGSPDKDGINPEEFKRFQEAFATFNLQPLIRFTPYQKRVWQTERRIVCPHGLEEVLFIELAVEYGEMQKLVFPEGETIGTLRPFPGALLDPELGDKREPAFVYGSDEREDLETWMECGHSPGESALVPSLRALRPQRNEIAPLGKDTPLYSFFPPKEFWTYEVHRS